MASEKRCLYEVLGLSRDCSPDEIRSAYRKLALQRHPDKLVQSGLSQADATAQFQELQHAYEVLSDPKERAWYDSHRSQILFSDRNATSNSPVPDLFSYFSNSVYSGYSDTGKGFFKVYSDVFAKIYSNEINFAKKMGLGSDSVKDVPLMGNLDSPYSQVTAFYNYWLGFSTVMDFTWVDEYDAMAGPNRKSRRVMEEENKKLRRKARREYNETVRGLAEFVRKRDKRVIDMTLKRKEEEERKREEEKQRKKQMERERMERARAYEEPEWAKLVEEDQEDQEDEHWEEAESKGKKGGDGGKDEELYCVVCRKKFKSEKQWKNHEQSKKHREKVAELRDSFLSEEEEEEENFEELRENVNVKEVEERFTKDLTIGEEEDGKGENEDGFSELSEEEDGFLDVKEKHEGMIEVDDDEDHDGDEEMSVLEAMMSGHKNRRNASLRGEGEVLHTQVHIEDESDERQFKEYDNQKSTRKNRRGKKEGVRKNGAEATNGAKKNIEGADVNEDPHMEQQEQSSHAFVESQSNSSERVPESEGSHKISKQSVDRKGTSKKDMNAKGKNSSKGKKAKVTTKQSGNVCDACGEEFQSRNKLHKHLGDTGHATLKSR